MTPPTLILMAGLPGAGKTTLALALSRALHIPMLDKDTIKATLLNMGIEEKVAAPTAYEQFFALAHDLVVLQGQSLILDSPTIFPRILTQAQDIAAEVQAVVKVILCYVEYDERQRRLATRPVRSSQLTAHLTPDEEAATWFDHLLDDTLRLDMGQPLETNLAAAVGYIQNVPLRNEDTTVG